MIKRPIRGVLFDSGDTLIRPRSGRWFPLPGFEEAVLRHQPNASFSQLERALDLGSAYLNETHPNDDWHSYYSIVLEGINVPPTTELIEDILRGDGKPAAEPFDDVIPCLEKLRSHGITMAIVSDSWPELPATYEVLGLRHFFKGFAISRVVGCTKPDPRIFAEGARIVGLSPPELLFVDDDPELVNAAIDLGYGGVALLRSGIATDCEVPRISNLEELPELINKP